MGCNVTKETQRSPTPKALTSKGSLGPAIKSQISADGRSTAGRGKTIPIFIHAHLSLFH